MRLFPALALLLCTFMGTACGITTPDNNTQETVNGTLSVGGQSSHNFTVKKNGEVFVTVTALTPPPPSSIGMAMGMPAASICSPLNGYVRAIVVNNKAEFGYLNKGDYCFMVYDVGALTAPTAYTAIISHP
jgi:hypothetical protein